MQAVNKYSREGIANQNDSLHLVSSMVNEHSRVLDVGCYEGALGKHLIETKHCVVDGIEYDKDAAEVAKKYYRNVTVLDLNLLEKQFDQGPTYDYVIFADVLEHLLTPEKVLSVFKKLLKDDGKIIISVPNVGYQGVIASLAQGEFNYQDTGILDKTHVKFFTRKTIKDLVESSGYYIYQTQDVIVPSSFSEFKDLFNIHNAQHQEKLLANFPDVDVYQFVMCCGLKDIENPVSNNSNKSQSSPSFKSTLYFKTIDKGYEESNSSFLLTPYSLVPSKLTYYIPSEVIFEELRFDPLDEDSYSIIKSIVLKSESDEILNIVNLADVLPGNEKTETLLTTKGLLISASEGGDPSAIIDICNNGDKLANKSLKLEIEIDLLNSESRFYHLAKSLAEENQNLITSSSWRLTYPLRCFHLVLINKVIPIIKLLRKRTLGDITKALYAGIKKEGLVKYCSRKIKDLYYCKGSSPVELYKEYLVREPEVSLRSQREAVDNLKNVNQPLISVILPVYNVGEKHLVECIESVIAQSYSNWELCICDDASNKTHIKTTLDYYSEKYANIKVAYRKTNGHISNTSNDAANLASGSHLVLLDHDDLLHHDALLFMANEIITNPESELIYSDEDHLSSSGDRIEPFFKPDWSPALLYSQNYIGHLVCISKSLFERVGGFSVGAEGAQDYDLLLKASGLTKSVSHIPRVLYHWREHEQSTASNANSKPYAHEAGKKALAKHLAEKYGNLYSEVEDGDNLFTYQPKFTLERATKVSIIIPIKDKVELLIELVESIESKTTWKNYEIIIVDNGSVESETKEYLAKIGKMEHCKIVEDNSDFNWSRVNQVGVSVATGDAFVFLNNDTVVISENWLESLISWAQLPDVGIVGPQLLYEDGTIQHAGIVVGMNQWADHVFKGEDPVHKVGPFVSPILTRNVLAVTGACQAITRAKYEELGGFDVNFVICGSDVELCLRAHNHGYFNVYLSTVQLYHLESKSRSSTVPDVDFELSRIKYEPYRTKTIDPFYNANLNLMSTNPVVKT
ncbi:glycosyltransferase [Vibrio sp. McD22-P3]|uniref:glycosyltransferase n=1 Tax=Vibrio sp. McD22-P3 TaxID=2724880 RepID=UPI001F26F431|nr:glycosyltransferase [Vibrio sp. McD22-P3]MCF4175273.1 glycosyltransferase [Vibrio sp. McD22-P3]